MRGDLICKTLQPCHTCPQLLSAGEKMQFISSHLPGCLQEEMSRLAGSLELAVTEPRANPTGLSALRKWPQSANPSHLHPPGLPQGSARAQEDPVSLYFKQ